MKTNRKFEELRYHRQYHKDDITEEATEIGIDLLRDIFSDKTQTKIMVSVKEVKTIGNANKDIETEYYENGNTIFYVFDSLADAMPYLQELERKQVDVDVYEITLSTRILIADRYLNKDWGRSYRFTVDENIMEYCFTDWCKEGAVFYY